MESVTKKLHSLYLVPTKTWLSANTKIQIAPLRTKLMTFMLLILGTLELTKPRP